jgi:hypothetical protein
MRTGKFAGFHFAIWMSRRFPTDSFERFARAFTSIRGMGPDYVPDEVKALFAPPHQNRYDCREHCAR